MIESRIGRQDLDMADWVFTQFPEEFRALPHFRRARRTGGTQCSRLRPSAGAFQDGPAHRLSPSCGERWVTAFVAWAEPGFPLSIFCSRCFLEFGSSPDGGRFATRAP